MHPIQPLLPPSHSHQPIVEATASTRFGCYTYMYADLPRQFKAAGLATYLAYNRWWDVYDMTPSPAFPPPPPPPPPLPERPLSPSGFLAFPPPPPPPPPPPLPPPLSSFSFMAQTVLACSHAARILPLPYEVAVRVGYTEDPGKRLVPFVPPPATAAGRLRGASVGWGQEGGGH